MKMVCKQITNVGGQKNSKTYYAKETKFQPRGFANSGSSMIKKYLQNSEHWGLGLTQILDEGPAAVATKLFRRSRDKFTSIPFEDFVRKASGNDSDCIRSFLWKYSLLSVKLYSDLLKAPKHCDILLQLKTELEEMQSDPFILVTIEHTWQNLLIQQRRQPRAFIPPKAMKGLSQKLDKSLDRVIINPLQQLLKRPATARHILEELEVLKHRFCDYYKNSDVDWNLAFDTNIWFLDHIRCEQQISTLAEAITKEDHALFSGYITLAFSKNENQSREQRQAQSLLNRRWNDFSNGVKYCMAAGIDVALQVDLLAEAFYRRRNYYSLTAIAQGVINVSGLATDTLRKFGNLVNPEGCYKYYRQHISVRTCALHFLSPAIFYWARGDTRWAQNVVSASASYTLTGPRPGPEMKFSPLDLMYAVRENGSSHQHGTTPCQFLFVEAFLVCFGLR
ncbi:uncharacterized protein N7446_007883 [Penicillium canescens]|uniref:Uncharacterized protein n=1 Tax=Penicillium canescens TaxID=5083 RepID=A0AAD6IP61_PENCN|nr:uncharacterized protein N7446_007883 [Penicillium canescens]KAJ6033825.1 hypothetical protein N7444_011596 [Penicillium canescens]KAJ6056984.1 hypothetical protein N7460_000258 [Penicillium canescens]KAJ6058300.1 hypothetical protein N7446_007883 [Penicillium canescens]